MNEDDKQPTLFITWDDAINNGNANEQNLARKGKELLNEVLAYRPLGTVAEITEALEESEKLADRSIEHAKELIEYRKLGTVDDIKLVLHVAKCVAQGMSIETFLLNYIDNLKDAFNKE